MAADPPDFVKLCTEPSYRNENFSIEMRDAVTQPSLDIEESYFSKNILFFYKNDFSVYYLKL